MTDTRTARMGVEQWSSGDDSPSRDGFNTTFANIEARTAIDQRTAGATLPSGTPTLVAAEYFQRTLDLGGGATAYALYRTDAGATWRAQSWIPETLRVRPPDTVPLVTADALRIEHTSVATAGLVASWDGTAKLRNALLLGNSAEPTVGRLSVGGLDAMPASVRARITTSGAERGLEIRAGADGLTTELLRLMDAAASIVLTVSGSGVLTSTQGAAFGGITPGAATLTVAPQSSGSLSTGLLAYGQESAPTRPQITVNRFQPGSTDVSAIFSVAPNLIGIGKVAGTDWGQIDMGAVLTRLVTARLAWFPTIASIPGGAPFQAYPGLTGFAGIDATNGVSSVIGTQFNNYGSATRDSATIASYPSGTNTWTGNLLRGYQAEIISGSPNIAEVFRVNPFGQIQSNAPWRGSGSKPTQLRDARQPIVHQCKRIWVVPGDYPDGQFIGSNGSFTYNWPTMTVRSSSITQLEVVMRMEALFFKQNSGANPDRQVMQVRWYYQIGGGSFILADSDYQEAASTTVDSPWPQAPGIQNTWTVAVPVTAAAGTTFRMRMIVSLYPYASDARLRRADLSVRESIIETYAPSE
ncbi:MAG TPA: hypothetical protein VE155_02720 [Pseudonocardiaceae bacterium]|nr:hypothetical protein [Pseudonocardiaceae bacterium]